MRKGCQKLVIEQLMKNKTSWIIDHEVLVSIYDDPADMQTYVKTELLGSSSPQKIQERQTLLL